MKRSIVFILLFASCVMSVFAGPFGIEMGMTLAQLEAVTGEKPGLVIEDFYNINVPKPHPLFEAYRVRVSPKYGVYFIKAMVFNIKTSGHGTELLSKYNSLEKSLANTYGNFERTDYLKTGSIWTEPQEWMMSLLKMDRRLYTKWDRNTKANLPENISKIFIASNATSTEVGYLGLEYYSNNSELADKEKAAETDSVF